MNPVSNCNAHASERWLGSLAWRAPSPSARARWVAATVLLSSVGLLAIAAWVEPGGRQAGTHQQLGLPPCSALVVTGLPCPTCGMTTAFAYTVRGRWISALVAQPAGFLLALGTTVAAVASIVVLVTGRGWQLNWYRITPAGLIGGLFAVIIAGWLIKIVVTLSGIAP